MKKLVVFLMMILSIIPCFADEGKILPSELGLVQKVEYVDLTDTNVTQTKQAIEVKLLTGQFKGETTRFLDNAKIKETLKKQAKEEIIELVRNA